MYEVLDSRFRGNDLSPVMPAKAGIQSLPHTVVNPNENRARMQRRDVERTEVDV